MRKLLLLVLVALLMLAALPAAAQDEGTVRVRVAHFSPDTPAVDIYVDGRPSDIVDIEFGTITDWVELPAGEYTLSVVPPGGIRSGFFTLPAGAFITVAAIGSLENNTLQLYPIVEDFSPIAEGRARVTVFHAIEDAPAVDVRSGEFTPIARLAYPGTIRNNDGLFTITPRAGTYTYEVVPSGASGPVVLSLTDVELAANTNYFVAAIGTLAAPQLAVAATDQGSLE